MTTASRKPDGAERTALGICRMCPEAFSRKDRQVITRRIRALMKREVAKASRPKASLPFKRAYRRAT